MEEKLKVVHLFSGIGAPERALDRLKIPYEIVGYSEIDKYAIQAYKALNGDVPSLGSVKDIERLPKANLVVYGSPCQDFSVAGNQKGLIDSEGNQTRSGLLFEVERLLEVAKAHDELPEYLLMENVKNLVSKKFKPDFDRWLNKLEELGYKNYWKVLNAKDYLIPQNRERVFVVSIRKDIDFDYTFPEPKPLQKRLKDILEEKVDEKYYLSEKAIAGFKKHNINHEAYGALYPTDNTIVEEGNIYPNSGRIYNSDGISPALDTMQGGNRQPKIIEEGYYSYPNSDKKHQTNTVYNSDGISPTLNATDYKNPVKVVEEPLIAASRGRYQEDGSTEQQLEINETGCANTLTTVQKDNLVVENQIQRVVLPLMVKVRKYPIDNTRLAELLRAHKKLTNKQISEALDVPLTKVEHWFRTDTFFAIPDAEIWYKLKELLGIETEEFDEAITTFEEREGVFEKNNRFYLDTGIAPTLTTTSSEEKIITNLRIRRLTPKECWRLMAFTDEEFDKVQATGISNTQLYKMAGNSIVVNCLVALFFNLLLKK